MYHNKQQDEKKSSKNFFLLIQGQFVSMIGSEIASIILMLKIKELTNMASLMALSMVIFSLSSVLFTSLAGGLADRYSRKNIILLCDIISGLFSITIGVGMFFLFQSKTITIIIILFAQFVIGSLMGVFEPSVLAMIPDLVKKENLEKVNSIKGIFHQIAILGGQSLGGILFKILTTPLLFIFNGVSYLLSALSEMFIKVEENHTHASKKHAPYFQSIKEGLNYIKNNKGIRNLILQFAFFNFLTSPFIVLLPFHIEKKMGLGVEWFGYIMAIFGAGVCTGFLLSGLLKIKKENKAKAVLICFIIIAIILVLFQFINNLFVLCLLAFLIGFPFAIYNLLCETSVQLSVASDIRGRILGIFGALTSAMAPLGMAIAGLIFDMTGKNLTLIFTLNGLAVLILALSSILDKKTQNILTY